MDLKSITPHGVCGFDSRRPHQTHQKSFGRGEPHWTKVQYPNRRAGPTLADVAHADATQMTGVPVDDPTQARWIVALILERATCLVCLASKVGGTPRDAVRALEWIANTLRFHAQARAHCGQCDLVVGPVYSIARPDLTTL
jgi:hypothetical protein